MIEIRWASSEYVVVQTLRVDEEALEKDLDSISSENTFTTHAQQQATTLHLFITDIQATVVRYEFLDFLGLYKGLFMDFQLLSGLILDKYDSVSNAILQMQQLKSQPGKRLLEFLSHCACTDVCEEFHCSFIDVENCAEIAYKTIFLKPNIAVPFKLSQIREELYAAIIHQLETYFNLDKLKAFQIFDNRRFHADSCSDEQAMRYSKYRMGKYKQTFYYAHAF
ncbi:unnamed protein product [Orchesella dallaii]|uniref:Uncharacterized protein n=1 Tax=Orchesella dallaii TaxID=48710 RepID=A0ABP1QWP1_9HEXA